MSSGQRTFQRDRDLKGTWTGPERVCAKCDTSEARIHAEIGTESLNDSSWYSSKEGVLYCHHCAVDEDIPLGGPVMPVHKIIITRGGENRDDKRS